MGSQERIGVAAAQLIVERDLRWIFRPQNVEDYGIDAQIERRAADGKGGARLVAMQVKCGPTYLTPTGGDFWLVPINERHVRYWLEHSLPVVMVIHDPAEQITYWELVTADAIERRPGKRPRVRVPKTKHLDATAATELASISDASPQELLRRRFTLAQRLIDTLVEEGALWVEVEEWVNKSSGRMQIRVLGKRDRPWRRAEPLDQWTDWAGPTATVREVVERTFSWAVAAIDEDHYREFERERFLAEYGWWDSESKEIHYDEDDLETWIDSREGTDRPFTTHGSGEVSLWRFKLTLSELGEALRREFYEELAKIHDEWLAQEELAEPREPGVYMGDYSDDCYHPEMSAVQYHAGDDFDVLVGGAGTMWEDPEGRLDVARAILEHHRDEPVSDIAVAAFAAHFTPRFEERGGDWAIATHEVQAWLDAF